MIPRPELQLRHLAQCLDSRRIPLNSAERGEVPGDVPYWGSGGVVGTVAKPLFNEVLVLLGEDGAPFYDKSRPVAYRVEGPVWVNNHIHVLRPRVNIDSRFLVYALNSVDYSRYISGSTRDKLTQDDMWSIRLPVPGLDEQRGIAAHLDAQTAKIDLLIEKQEQLIETLAERRQAVISHAVTKGLDPNAELKDSGVDWLGRVPLSWPIVKVGYAFTVTVGKMLNAGNVAHGGEVVPYLRAANIQPDGLVTREIKSMTVSTSEMRSFDLRRNDVVVVEGGGGYGRSDVLREDLSGWVFQNHVLRVRSRHGDSSDYFNYLMKTINSNGHVASLSNHATIPSISSDKLASVRFGLPDIAVQEGIVNYLDLEAERMDALAAKAQDMIDVLKERRQALISAAVTGKIDVRGLS